MVLRQFFLRHGSELFSLDYDTDDGFEVFKFQIFSLTSVPPDEQKILVEEGNVVVTETSNFVTISDKLLLISDEAGGCPGGAEQKEADPSVAASAAAAVKNMQISDEDFARRLQEEEDALYLQQLVASDSGKREFEERVRPHVSQVLMYEDPNRQQEARKTVPIDKLEEKALVSLSKVGVFKPCKEEIDHAFLLELLFWFKKSFRWVNAPECEFCGGETGNSGMGAPLSHETRFSASRVELYRCHKCSKTTRFPRYNDPLKLLETRRGRCGEWANCFTLYCRAFGYESRLILDFTDHVWTECFSQYLGRWMHLDPCEGIYDNPLLYENGWGKKLTYVIALSKDGTSDVTKRYTRKWDEVLSRRNITTEASALAILSGITAEQRRDYLHETLSNLQDRDREEAKQLEAMHLEGDSLVSLPGRQSGSKEWRKDRSELGPMESDSLGCTSCPLRICFDEHVREIYDSFSHILSEYVNTGLTTSQFFENIAILKRLLIDLKTSSYKDRKAFINRNLGSSKFFESRQLADFLSALALKQERLDLTTKVSLAGEPVKTSVALPVALHVIDELLGSRDGTNSVDSKFLNFFKRFNRISCGSVLASGEELPFGISTAAFDGVRLSKWEEPNGAKGCWLLYKVSNGKIHHLEAYDVMSANDAPERDPMDWILEGSDDGGSNWYVLDHQKSQVFTKRFQRKRFKVDSSRKANTFRFKFLLVRDAKATSRFQIGGIDFYAKDI